jgi:hypothetical protein
MRITLAMSIMFVFLKHILRNGSDYTECFIILSMITNIYDKKTKRPTLIELFTATED